MNNPQQLAQDMATGQQPALQSTNGINMQNLIDEFNLSRSYVQQYTRDFVMLDNLVDAVPLDPDDDVPFVGDTTLAGLVRSIPRNSLQQLPVFSVAVNGSKKRPEALICTYLLKKFAFNEDTFGKGLLSTLQIGAEQALTHGYAPFMVGTGLLFNDFGTTMRLLHFSDSSPEPGITDHNETGYDYVVSHPTPSRVRKILANAKNNPNTLWNTEALEHVLAGSPRATEYSQYQSQPRQNQAGEAASPTYEFVTRYETGAGGTIITFCPEYPDMPLRVLDNNSKWGYPRIMYLVIDPAALTPFGVSRVRLASPNQNLMNIYYGNIASMLLLNSKPPILKRGRFTTPVQLKQGVVWETMDQNATAELKTIDNGALGQFVTIAQQFAGQIQNIMGGQTMTVNAGSKASGFSKTAPGVKQSQDFLDINTNQITKILENFLRQYALVALDTLFAEQVGDDKIIVDDETKDMLNTVSPGFVGEDNKVEINWERFYAAIEDWTVTIDVSLSKDELDEKKRGDLQDMLVVLAQNAQEIGPDAVTKVKEITNLLMQDKAPLLAPMPAQSPAMPPMAPGTEAPMAPQPQPQ